MLRSSMESGNPDHGVAPNEHDEEINDAGRKLIFLKKLQAVTNRIHSASNVDEIIGHMSEDICGMFGAERLTIYTVADNGNAIVSKVKTGMQSFKDIKLPI